MLIGEILLARGWVEWEALALALTDQRGTGARLCSMLVSRGIIDFDHAALALGEQHGVAAVMRRHLERRDRGLAALLPAKMGRSLGALPIGRLGNGTLIVAVRDPWPALQVALRRAIGEDVMMAIAPARYLERIIDHVYADVDVPIDVEDDAVQFDVDLDEPALSFDDIPVDIADEQEEDSDIAVEVDDGSDIAEEPEETNIAVEIEPPDAPKPKSRALPVEIKRPAAAARDSLDEAIASFAEIDSLEWLLDVVIGYVAKRWRAALILELADTRATSARVHGKKLKARGGRLSFENVLTEPSLVQMARDERRLVSEAPEWPGIAHANLLAMLDDAKQPAAVPVVTGDAIRYMLVVGDPLAGDAETAATDLEVLAEAISGALERM